MNDDGDDDDDDDDVDDDDVDGDDDWCYILSGAHPDTISKLIRRALVVVLFNVSAISLEVVASIKITCDQTSFLFRGGKI